jgi:hypothetical protein
LIAHRDLRSETEPGNQLSVPLTPDSVETDMPAAAGDLACSIVRSGTSSAAADVNGAYEQESPWPICKVSPASSSIKRVSKGTVWPSNILAQLRIVTSHVCELVSDRMRQRESGWKACRTVKLND